MLRAPVSSVVPPERLRDILPDDSNEGIVELPRYSEMFPSPNDDGVAVASLGHFLLGEFASNA